MKSSKAKAYHLTAVTAQHYPANACTHVDLRLPLHAKSRGRRRIDPLAGVWDDEVVPMLRVAPGLRPIVAFRKISHCHPEIGLGIRRTLERRIRLWQGLNDPSPEVTFLRGPSPDQWFLTPRLVSDLLRSAHQGVLKLSDLPEDKTAELQMFAGEFVLDLGLPLKQPVHGGVELVLAGVGDLEVFGQCRRVPPAGCRQLGIGRNNPRGHHRQYDVALATRLGSDEGGKAKVRHGQRDGLDRRL
jgi:hypothetical protein